MQVQKDAGSIVATKRVFYKNGAINEPVSPGYAVCYDIAEDLTPQAGEFDELVRGNVVVQPATANLEYFAGIVFKVGQRSNPSSLTDFSCWLDIIEPKWGTFCKALVLADSSGAVKVLLPVNGEWYLGVDAVATADVYSRRSVALTAEAVDYDAIPGPGSTPLYIGSPRMLVALLGK